MSNDTHGEVAEAASGTRLHLYQLNVAEQKPVGLAQVMFTQNIDMSAISKANMLNQGRPSIVLTRNCFWKAFLF